jgi:hypothetical protein
MVNLPVLVVGFNRPDLLQNLLVRLNDLNVTDVYVSLDGPRNAVDYENCNDCLKVAQTFSTKFNMRIISRSYNLGCNSGVVSALDWFFSQVEFGVVIEDDCYPDNDLLNYFEKFKQGKNFYQDQRVFIASAHNPFIRMNKDSISKYTLIGAWATWADVWHTIRLNYFKIDMPIIKNVLGEKRNWRESIYWWVNSIRAKLGYLDTWDGIFSDKAWRCGFRCLIPASNLVTNFGFRQDGTHTKNSMETNLIRLNNDTYMDANIDDLLVKHYFRIRIFHSVTPVLRLLIEFLRFRSRKRFEVLLNNDKISRIHFR